MARPVSTDFLHSMRFHVSVIDSGNTTLLRTGGSPLPEAGFSQVSTPEMNIEAVEYKEGQYIYTRKYPGNPSMGDITMSRGVTRSDSSFWSWAQTTVEGSGHYRADLEIKHFHREQALARPADQVENQTTISIDSPAIVYQVKEAFPIRHKVAADLDATASEISIMELDVAYEHFFPAHT